MDNKQMLDRMRFCNYFDCNSDCVDLYDWEEMANTPEWPEHWTVTLYCGDCQRFYRDIFSQNEVELFEEWLDDCMDAIQREYKKLMRQNMHDEANNFARLLELDLITPEDF